MKLLALLSLVVLSGCATGKRAVEKPVEKTKSFTQSYDAVWSKIIKHFSSKSYSIKSLEKASGIISTDSLSVDSVQDKKYFDCGNYTIMGTEVPMYGKGSFNVFVEKVSDKETKVTVNTLATVVNDKPGSTGAMGSLTLNCYSTGALEQQMFEALK